MSQETKNESMKHLYRSRHDRMISGVCGGFAEYLEVDVLIIRLIWVLLTLFGGVGLLLYIAAVIIMPENPAEYVSDTEKEPKNNKAIFWGSLFILIGLLLLLKQVGFFYYLSFWNIPWQVIWAVFLILIGIFLMYNHNPFRKNETEDQENISPEEKVKTERRQIYRSREDRMLAGVCAGLAEYFNLDATVVRLSYVLLSLASVGIGIVAYVVMILVFPEKPLDEEV